MKAREQFEYLAVVAREYGISVFDNGPRSYYRYVIGRGVKARQFTDTLSASCALLSAFKRAGIAVRSEVTARPDDLDPFNRERD